MTEIPEHLLKRSRDRRAALGLGGGEAQPSAEARVRGCSGGDAGHDRGGDAGSRRPGRSGRSQGRPRHPPRRRRRSPTRRTWRRPSAGEDPVLGDGRAVVDADLGVHVRPLAHRRPRRRSKGRWASAPRCTATARRVTAARARVAAGRPLADGEVNKTFPHIEDQLRFVYFGTEGYNLAGVTSYGDPNREGGAHATGSFGLMPAWGTGAGGDLTDAEILAVVCHERYGFDGRRSAPTRRPPRSSSCGARRSRRCYAALEAGTPLADLDTAGITDADGAPPSRSSTSATPPPRAARPDRPVPPPRRRWATGSAAQPGPRVAL